MTFVEIAEISGLVLTSAATIGMAWGGAKAGARAMGRELREIKNELKEHMQGDEARELVTERRMSRVETLVEQIHRKVKA